ncbi:acetylcholine receptor subunit alpha-L1-like [Babylonia areolata]|uniref:acetylcholine receptor subunit alpha-L1-like n=1 Tax=Babylonia areolata TaxID=304850 RepID=UPI003FCF2803
MANFVSCHAEIKDNRSFLYHEILMKNYDPLSRPVANFSQQVHVNLSIGMKTFIELDMKKQTLVSFGWLAVNWYDEFLRWDLNQYPYQDIHLNPDMVWLPDLVIFNTVSDVDQLEDQTIKVIVHHTGKVTWYPGGLFQTFCSVNIFYYPLDTQTCSVDVSAWTSSNDILNGTTINPAFQRVEETESHPEWKLIGMEAEYQLFYTNYWCIYFTFILKRKVVFYVLNMIVPVLLLSLMNCLVFLLPAESGEKMTVSVTTFISFELFFSFINDSLPQNSDTPGNGPDSNEHFRIQVWASAITSRGRKQRVLTA